MKKTLTINISGTVFNIEDDAYDILKTYLSKVGSHFKSEEGGSEIVNDIEARISELFTQKTSNNNNVVTEEMVREIIDVMGLPEDFDDNEETTKQESTQANNSYNSYYRQNKRLYRDPDSRVIGGVCSGLAHYLNMDKAIVRILFFIFFLITSGAGLLAYFILWVAVPKARTTSQRLEMRGEKINAENIGKSVKEEYNEMKENFDKFKSSEEYTKGREYARNAGRSVQRAGSETVSVLGKIFGAFFLFIGLTALIGLIIGVLATTSIIGFIPGMHQGLFVNQIYSGGMATTLMISAFIIAAIPLLLIIYAGTKLLFNYISDSRTVVLSALGVWIIAIILAAVTAIGAFDVFSSSANETENNILDVTSDTIFIAIDQNNFKDLSDLQLEVNNFSLMMQGDKEILVAKPKFTIEQSNSDSIELKMRKSSRGNNYQSAKSNASEITYSYTVDGSKLMLDPYFRIDKNGKWRSQEMEIILKLPVGKVVFLNENLLSIIYDIENTANIWDGDMVGEYWIMNNEGLTLSK